MQVEIVPIASISPDPANARRHPDRNLEAIKGSLRRFGQQKPIVIDRNGVVRAGNGTLAAAKALGWSEIAVVRSDLPLSELTAFAIADNRTAELAEWDEEVLLKTLQDPEIGDVGFDESEIAKLEAPSGDEWASALGDVPGGDRQPFQQMTFTLHDSQAETVKMALKAAQDAGPFDGSPNENSNGNALARIADAYLGQR